MSNDSGSGTYDEHGNLLFTREQLMTRNTREDAILIIHNCVYNVSKFLDEHPGGEEVLLDKAGQDASEAFEDVSHSSDARQLMLKYKIGELVKEDHAPARSLFGGGITSPGSTDKKNSWSGWMAPLVLGIVATMIYHQLYA